MKKKNIIGRKVRRLRRNAGLSVEELAERTYGKLSLLDVQRIETGSKRVLDDEVLVLAFALDVDLHALFPKR